MSTTTPDPTERNGVNVTQLTETIGAIQQDPTLASFRFRASTAWQAGGHSRTEIKSFWGAGTEDISRTAPFTLEGDEPPVLLGENHGQNAVETVLHALTSCLAVGFVYNAAPTRRSRSCAATCSAPRRCSTSSATRCRSRSPGPGKPAEQHGKRARLPQRPTAISRRSDV